MKTSVKLEDIIYFLSSSKEKYDKWVKHILNCDPIRKYSWLIRLVGSLFEISDLNKLTKEEIVYWSEKLFEDGKLDKLKLEFVKSVCDRFPENVTPVMIESLIESFVLRNIIDKFYDDVITQDLITSESVLNYLWRTSSIIKEFNKYEVDDENIEEILDSGSFEVGGKIGIDLLDDYLTGYPKSGYTIVAGKTGIGKTYFLLNSFIESLKNGYSALFISPEMSFRAIINRTALLTTGFKPTFLRNKSFYIVDELPIPHEPIEINNDERKNFQELKKEFINEWYERHHLKDRFVCADVSGNLISFHTIESAIIDFMEKYGKVDIIFIDAPEMLSIKWAKNEFDEIQQKSLFFNKIAIEYDIAVVVSWQLKKDTYKKKCNLSISDIKGRNEISQKASLILAIIQDSSEKMFNLLRVETLKVRHDVPIYPPPIIVNSALKDGRYVDKVAVFDNNKIQKYLERISELANLYDTSSKIARDYRTFIDDSGDVEDDFPF